MTKAPSKSKKPDVVDEMLDSFFGDLDTPKYTQSVVLRLAGARLTSVVLQNWANRGIVSAAVEPSGRRLYTPRQVALICIALPLISGLRMSPPEAMRIVGEGISGLVEIGIDALRKSHPKKLAGWPALTNCWLFYDVDQRPEHGPRGNWKPIAIVQEEDLSSLIKRADGAISLRLGSQIHDLGTRAYVLVNQEKGV